MTGMGRRHDTAGSGPSQRQLRVAELIRRTLSDVLARGDVHDPDLARIPITVSEVRTSPDLKVATAYVMPLGGERRDEALSLLARNAAPLRKLVSRALTLKFAPELRFRLDTSFDAMDEARRLFAQETVRRDVEAGRDESDPDGTPDRG